MSRCTEVLLCFVVFVRTAMLECRSEKHRYQAYHKLIDEHNTDVVSEQRLSGMLRNGVNSSAPKTSTV